MGLFISMEDDGWINEFLIPYFFNLTGILTGKIHIYDPFLARAACKHAEYLAKIRQVQKAPPEFLDGAVENAGYATIINYDVYAALENIANSFMNLNIHETNLRRHPCIGIGIALERGKKAEKNALSGIYVVERLR